MSEINLPYDLILRDYQQPVWDAFVHGTVKRGLTVWPRRNGKDLIALNILVAKAIQRVGTYLYVGPYATQTRNIIWTGANKEGRRFLDYIPPQLIKKKYETTKEILLVNDSLIRITGSDDPDSLVGGNPVGMVGTEFSLWRDGVLDLLRPIFAENDGWFLLNGTPRGLNHMYELAKSVATDPSESGAKHPDKWFYQYLTRDNTNIPTEEAIQEERESGMPESQIKQEFYCSWTSSSEEICIPLDIIEPCLNNKLHKAEYENEPIVLGVDVAFAAKGDKATIAIRQGRLLHPVRAFQGLDAMDFADQIVIVIKEYNPSMVFIDAGMGDGVISRLRRLGYGEIIVPINFGGTPQNAMYANRTTEMWVRTRDWINSATAAPQLPAQEELIRELSGPYLNLDNDRNKVAIESKKARKTRGIPSTDHADAVILTHAEDTIALDFMLSWNETTKIDVDTSQIM